MRTEVAGIDVGDVAADRAVGDAILDLAHRVGEALHVFARRLEKMKGQALRALGADAGQTLKLLDQPAQRIGTVHQKRPGIFRPPIIPPICFCSASSALRCASLMAARIRSCSISTSSFDTASGSILSD